MSRNKMDRTSHVRAMILDMPTDIDEGIRIALDGPASPARVAKVANMFASALEAMAPDMPESSVTLVVNNLNLKGHLRPKDPEGHAVVRSLAGVIDNPLDTIQKHPELRSAATELGRKMKELVGVGGTISFFRKGEEVERKIDDTMTNALEAVGRASATKELRGNTLIYSPVLRVGRSTQGSAFKVRLVVYGKNRDINVSEGSEASFLAALGQGIHRVSVFGTWVSNEQGDLVVKMDSLRADGIQKWSPISGTEFVEAFDGIESLGEQSIEDWADELGIDV